jgi:glycosyltransferase involved in cell wall biosynthesis
MPGFNKPKVSICIPTFNSENYLREAIESALIQNNQDLEIVIVDNCSTDHTGTLVKDFQKREDRRIRFYKNDRNIGLAGNFNKCLEYAKGEYIKFLCSDDLLLPECIERMAGVLDAHQSVSLVCSGRLILNRNGEKLGYKKYLSAETIIRGSSATTRCLFGKNYIGEPTAVMFRKRDAGRYFREDLPQLMDMEMWFYLLEQGDLLNIGVPLCAIRLHSGQMTHTNKESGKLIDDNVKLFDEYSQKSYLEVTPLLMMKRRMLMTYRVWVSRKFIPDSKKKMILERYASKFMYMLMPLVGSAISLEKWVMRKMRNFHL